MKYIYISHQKKDEKTLEALLLSVSLNIEKTPKQQQKLITNFLLVELACSGITQRKTFHFFSID